MKRMNKFLSTFLALIMVFTIIPMSAITVGAEENAPLKVDVTTDKSSYKATGIAEITVRITNTSDETVSNISAEAVFDDLAPVKKKKSVTFKEVENLQPSDSFEFEYKATINADGMKVGFFDKIGLWFVRLFNGGYDASSHNTTALIKETTVIKFGKYTAENVVVVDYDEQENICEEYEELIKDVDIDAMYEYDSNDIITDEDTGIKYLDNIIIIIFDVDCTDVQRAEIIKSVNGKVLGGNTTYKELYVEVKSGTLEELEELCDNLCEKDGVYLARPEEFTSISNATNDPFEDNGSDGRVDWNVNMSELNNTYNNWWVLATELDKAWEYKNYSSNINIGIVDSGFDVSHEDYKDKFTLVSEENSPKNHGTHVVGIIGAEHNNGKGIAGVVDKCSLYGYDAADSSGKYVSDTEIYDAVETLVKEQKCKVINLSFGKNVYTKDNKCYTGESCNIFNKLTQKKTDKWGAEASEKIGELLKEGYDFVVVQSAGNGSKNEGKGIDADNNGYFCSITDDNCYSKDISKEKIMNRVIVVANSDMPTMGEIRLNKSSNGNTKYVDVSAPGTMIYSTVAGIEQKLDEVEIVPKGAKYAKLSGTSMAAPIVAGIAGLVWSIDENLSGADVKDIILKSAKEGNTVAIANESSYTSGDFYMVNAKLAVEEAIRKSYGELVEFTGWVIDEVTGKPILDVSVEFIDNKGDSFEPIMTTTTDADGKYSVKLPSGSYSVSFNHDDYEYYGTSITTSAVSHKINASLLPVNNGNDGEDNEGGDNNGENGDNNCGNEENIFSGGNGTEINPYQVSTPKQLDAVRNNLSAHYVQIADIDMSEWNNWEPIGTPEEPFIGTYDGNNHIITNNNINVSINSSSEEVYIGIFSFVQQATIKNLTICSSKITITSNREYNYIYLYVSNIVAYAEQCEILNCNSLDNDISIFIQSGNTDCYVGGIIGYANEYARIENCASENSYNVNCKTSGWIAECGAEVYAGGIIGVGSLFNEEYSIIKNSTSNCEFVSENYDNAKTIFAGIAGSFQHCDDKDKITQCVNYSYFKSDKPTDDGALVLCGITSTCTMILDSINYGNFNIKGDGSVSIAGIGDATIIENCNNYGDIYVDSSYDGVRAKTTIGGISRHGKNIKNCINYGNITGDLRATETDNIAGVACYVRFNGEIINCRNMADITLNIRDNHMYISTYNETIVGGIVSDMKDGKIIQCANEGKIVAIGIDENEECSSCIGGIVAYVHGDKDDVIECYNIGNVCSNECAGGIVGEAQYTDCNISNSYNLGTIQAISHTNHYHNGMEDTYIAGILGRGQAKINYCYNAGYILRSEKSENYCGEISSDSTLVTLNNAFALKGVNTDMNDSEYVIMLSSSQMSEQENFNGFDFDNTWEIKSGVNNNYPYLKSCYKV